MSNSHRPDLVHPIPVDDVASDHHPAPLLRILLVEDNEGDAVLERLALDESCLGPHEFHRAKTLAEAVAFLQEHGADVALLDLGLPDAWGVEVVEKIHAISPNLPLVVLTGLEDPRIVDRVLGVGAQDYLRKDELLSDRLERAVRFALLRGKGLPHTAPQSTSSDQAKSVSDGLTVRGPIHAPDGDIFSLIGRFCLSGHDSFGLISDFLSTTPQRVVLDLENLEFMDSSGLGMILIAQDAARERNIQLILHRPQGRVARLFSSAGLSLGT